MTDSREDSVRRRKSGALGRVGIVSPAPLPAPQPCSFSFGLSKYPGPPCIPLPFSCSCGPSLNRSTFLFPSTRDRESLKGSGAPSAHLDGASDAQRRFCALYLQLQHAQVLTARGDGARVTRNPGEGRAQAWCPSPRRDGVLLRNAGRGEGASSDCAGRAPYSAKSRALPNSGDPLTQPHLTASRRSRRYATAAATGPERTQALATAAGGGQ
ncbi:uncharacterized protein LOC131384042 [Hylobates moloch]|uniref:uncharacterized protein LOC131384042 n=1 Tax=Hylobates moloch TaxID=81572 RepID=UPI0026744989|nr:uncharacterized protein LOC131384042 [Hylobates moloch]